MNLNWGYYIAFGIIAIIVLLIMLRKTMGHTARLIIVVGLPGSGKTRNALKEFKSLGWEYFDDFYSRAKNDIGKISNAINLPELIKYLDDGVDCVISDIIYCDPTSLMDAINELESICKFEWLRVVFFSKDLKQCKENVIERNSKSRDKQLELIDKLGPGYQTKISGYDSIEIQVWDSDRENYSYHDILDAFVNKQ